MENSTHSFRKINHVLQLVQKLRIKTNCDELELAKEKQEHFVTFILAEGNFFNICVLSQCIVYLIIFQKIYTFTYQKLYFIHFFFCFKERRIPSVYP